MRAFNYTLTMILICLTLTSTAKDKNGWSGEYTTFKLWDHWSANFEVGLTSYFGDLSQYDLQLVPKLTRESHFAYAGSLTKTWYNCDLSGQLMYGGFKSDYKAGHVFKTRVIEYNVQFGIHLLGILAPSNLLPFEIKPYVGVGQFVFNTFQYGSTENEAYKRLSASGTPEFVYFFGGRFEYSISNRVNVCLNLSVRQAQNDKLDNYVHGNSPDYYTFTSVGVNYAIEDIGALFRKHRMHRQQTALRVNH